MEQQFIGKKHFSVASSNFTQFYCVHSVQFNFRGEWQHHRKEAEEGTDTQKEEEEKSNTEEGKTTENSTAKNGRSWKNNRTQKEDHFSVIYLTALHPTLISLSHCSIQFQKEQRQHNGQHHQKGGRREQHHPPTKRITKQATPKKEEGQEQHPEGTKRLQHHPRKENNITPNKNGNATPTKAAPPKREEEGKPHHPK